MSDTASRLAQLNAATQRLERSRAAIAGAEGQPSGDDDSGDTAEGQSAGSGRIADSATPTLSSAPAEATEIALVAPKPSLDAAVAVNPPARTNSGAITTQVIPDRSRQVLLIFGAVVAVGLTLFRFSGTLRRRRRSD